MGGTSTAEKLGTDAKTLASMIIEAGERYSDNAALRFCDNDRWVEMSYDELVTAVPA